VLARCLATVGALSNPLHKNRKLGKAGARRWLGRRPVVCLWLRVHTFIPLKSRKRYEGEVMSFEMYSLRFEMYNAARISRA
jgi:Ribosomal Proteins L2, C-terminal domain